MTLTPAQVLAAADRVRDAATRTAHTPALERTGASSETPAPAPELGRTAAARASWLAAEGRDLERSAQTLADLPRRRGAAPKR